MKWEKNKNTATDFLLSFFIITACITIMEAVIGTIFMPGERFGFEAFFSPPLFGFLSALSSVVTFPDVSFRQERWRSGCFCSLP